MKLNKKQRQELIGYLESGQDIPDDYKRILFPPEKKEYELIYDRKEREEDIIVETWGVPLQKVKTFNLPKNKEAPEWTNRLIFGDNLQVMKRLLDDPQVKGKVKLVYIDPPFATKQDFQGSQDQKAYQDKIAGAEFIEFIRKRLIFIKELMSPEGYILVHIDWKKGHYVRIILDELFGEHNFVNEIIWHYRKWSTRIKAFQRNHDTIFCYAKKEKNPERKFEIVDYEAPSEGTLKRWKGKKQQAQFDESGRRIASDTSEDSNGSPISDVWKDIEPLEEMDTLEISIINPAAVERVGYPTQKPEALLDRIIRAYTSEHELVMDVFAGSGTTCAVAEKLGRRWIGVDSGKLAVYTMQKRLLNLRSDIGQKGKLLKASTFTLYNAGLYDFKRMSELPWEDYRLFALQLFQVRNEKHKLSGIQLDGFKDDADVLVFNFQEHNDIVLDEEYINNLHLHLKGKTRSEFYIIAPASRVTFLEDYIDIGNTRFYILRIPYSIIDELHSRPFQEIHQPVDEAEVNNTVEAVGFDFIIPPKLKAVYSYGTKKGEVSKSAVITIEEFHSKAMTKRPRTFGNRETLSMVMVDYDYKGNGEGIFDLDAAFYRDDIEKDNWKVFLDEAQFGKQIMIIYLDIFGNELREIKTPNDFGIKLPAKKAVRKKTAKKAKK